MFDHLHGYILLLHYITFGTVSSLREAGEECCCHYCDKINGVLLVTSVVPQVHPIAAASVIENLCRLLSARSVGCALPGYIQSPTTNYSI